jgi:hypothetical protein
MPSLSWVRASNKIKVKGEIKMLFHHPKRLCATCLETIQPKIHTPGHILVELMLWVLFIIPGFIYTVWRNMAKKDVCPLCMSDQLLPLDSKRAKLLLSQNELISHSTTVPDQVRKMPNQDRKVA